MKKDEVCNAYFEWLINLVWDEEHFVDISYRRLLMHLHNTEFTWLIDMDANRAQYGIDLRHRFTDRPSERACLAGSPCSVLEMMVALALQCEETITTNPEGVDQTHIWFWEMIDTLGLSDQFDKRYNKKYVNDVMRTFLQREYSPDGQGGLFFIKNPKQDVSKVEIWYQMLWHLNDIL